MSSCLSTSPACFKHAVVLKEHTCALSMHTPHTSRSRHKTTQHTTHHNLTPSLLPLLLPLLHTHHTHVNAQRPHRHTQTHHHHHGPMVCVLLRENTRVFRFCRANEQYRVQLNSLAPSAVSFLDSLPHTLARTGIPPAGWNLLSLEEFKCLLNFLWCCAADGTTAPYRRLPEAPPFAFDRVQAERSTITPFLVPSAPMPLPRSVRGHGAAKHLVLLSLMTRNVASCMWTAAIGLLPKTLLRNVVGACSLCVQMLFKGNFAIPFSVVWYVTTFASSNRRTQIAEHSRGVGCMCARFGVCPVSAFKSQFHDLF